MYKIYSTGERGLREGTENPSLGLTLEQKTYNKENTKNYPWNYF